MKKRLFIRLIGILILIILVIILIVQVREKDESPKHEGIDTFDYYYYEDRIQRHRKDSKVDPITGYDDVISKAELILTAEYGDLVNKTKPLKAYYNSQFDLWMVRNTPEAMVPQGYEVLGGDLFCIIEEKTGNVIAYWGEK